MTDQDTDDTSDNASDGAAPGADVATSRDAETGKRKAAEPAPAKRGWVRRHWVISAFLALAIVIGTAAGAYAYMLNRNFANIDRVMISGGKDGLIEEERPDPVESEALNILLLGADAESENNNNSSSIAEDMAQPQWPVGSHRSDTVIVMHISADRQNVYLASIPRDSYVPIYDQRGDPRGTDKINSAFSYYGPAGAVSTVEHLTNLRMDHLAIMDWNGLKDLSTAVGGVRLYIPETFYDESQQITWEKGWQDLEGEEALAYVRTRYGLENGDFDRIKRQQNFIRALMKQFLSTGTMNNPLKLNSSLGALTKNLTIDDDWTDGDIRGLALAMRGISADDVQFLTVPTAGYGYDDNGQSIVKIDNLKSKQLFNLMKTDNVQKYIEQNPKETLDGDKTVS